MVRIQVHIWALMIGITLWLHPALAQQKDPQSNSPLAPDQPLSFGPSSGNETGASEAKSPQPDTRPLSGAELFTLGGVGSGPGYLISQIHLSQIADTNGRVTTQKSGLSTATQLSGSIAYEHFSSRSQFTTTYAGGSALYNDRPDQINPFQQLGIAETTAWHRWVFLLADQMGYFPESSFGYSSTFNPVGNLGNGLGLPPSSPNPQPAQLNPIFQPNQTIFTGRAGRISNSAVGQVEYELSPRSSLTATGSYGILTFFSPGFIDSNSVALQTGYNYALNGRDSIGVVYGFTRTWLDRLDSRFDAQNVQLAYGRRVTGRLALELFGGPQFRKSRNAGVRLGTQLSGGIGTSLTYRLPRTGFDLSYFRGITGGGGIFAGAESDEVQGTASRRLSRFWQASFAGGYARNRSLRELTVGSQEFRFDSWRGNLTLSRTLGRRISWFLSYNLQWQTSSSSFCAGIGCGSAYLRHQFGLGFDWDVTRIRVE